MHTTTATQRLRGAEFLIKDSTTADIFIPEEFSEEALMVRDMTVDFLRTRVLPVFDDLETLNHF